jgi:hypothetical protein
MIPFIDPSSPCRCCSGKSYLECCAQLTHLPQNASTELKRRYWGKYIDEVIGTLLSSLDAKDLYTSVRIEAEAKLIDDDDPTTVDQMVMIFEDAMSSVAIDAFALFHLKEEVPPDTTSDEENSEVAPENEEQELLEVPIAIMLVAAEGLFRSDPQRTVFSKLLLSPFSWFRVVDVQPNESLTLQDLILDRQVTVVDRAASLTARKGVIICGKVLYFDGIAVLAGVFSRMLPPRTLQLATELTEEIRSVVCSDFEGNLDESTLTHCATLVLSTFIKTYISVSSAPLPTLHNTDGDLIELSVLNYEFRGSTVQAMAHSIAELLDSNPEGPQPEIEKRDRKGNPTRISIPYVRKSPEKFKLDSTILAFITVERKKVSVEVNSSKRAEHLQEILSRLSNQLTFVSKTDPPVGMSTSQVPPEELPPEIHALFEEKLREHQEKWLTNPVPALQGMTPIEASQSTKMRPVLEALLDDFAIRESSARGSSFRTFDVEELRTRLGFNAKVN